MNVDTPRAISLYEIETCHRDGVVLLPEFVNSRPRIHRNSLFGDSGCRYQKGICRQSGKAPRWYSDSVKISFHFTNADNESCRWVSSCSILEQPGR